MICEKGRLQARRITKALIILSSTLPIQGLPGEIQSARKAEIVREVRQVAIDHINAPDAPTALSHYASEARVASLGFLYPSFDSLSADVHSFYDTIERVNIASWDKMHVDVICDEAAVVTATFHWNSTDTSGAVLDLQGAWTAVFTLQEGDWKIRILHESVLPSGGPKSDVGGCGEE